MPMPNLKRSAARSYFYLAAGARIEVVARHQRRDRRDPGFVGRCGTILRTAATGGEQQVLVELDDTIMATGKRREWMWPSEITRAGP